MARSRTKKNLRRKEKRAANKSIELSERQRPNNVTPEFSINYLLREETFGIPTSDIPLLAEVFGKLEDFQSMTIAEALRNDDTLVHYGPEKITCFCEYAQNRLNEDPEYELFNEDGIWRYRLTGELRVYAFRIGERTFEVVWIDPYHDIYPLKK